MKLAITIPAYNEEKTIPHVLREIPRTIDGIDSVQIILIDDGSTDDTIEKAVEYGVDLVVAHKTNTGLGSAFKTGIETALEEGADIIVNIDADGQYNATQIPDLVKPILDGKADIVLGWRDIGSLDHMPWSKKIGNRMATWITRRLAGYPIKDAQTGFRAFSRDAALWFNLSGSYTYVQETIIQACHKGQHIVQVPIEFRARPGKSRLISNVGSYAIRAGRIILSTYRDCYPLKFFSLIGGFFLVLGLAFGARVLVHYGHTGMVSPYHPSAVLASLFVLLGLGSFALGIFLRLLNNQKRLIEEALYRLRKVTNGTPDLGDSRGSVLHNKDVKRQL